MKTNPNENTVAGIDDAPGTGLTKRELFAIHALQGLLSAAQDHQSGAYTIATKAVTLADSLILALNNLETSQP